MRRYQLDVVGISEMSWTGRRKERSWHRTQRNSVVFAWHTIYWRRWSVSDSRHFKSSHCMDLIEWKNHNTSTKTKLPVSTIEVYASLTKQPATSMRILLIHGTKARLKSSDLKAVVVCPTTDNGCWTCMQQMKASSTRTTTPRVKKTKSLYYQISILLSISSPSIDLFSKLFHYTLSRKLQ